MIGFYHLEIQERKMANIDEVSRAKVFDFYNTLNSLAGDDDAVNRFYDKIATTYDDVNRIIGRFSAVAKFADAIKQFSCCNGRKVEDVKVIDIGAGTGMLGEALADVGFKDVHALDPSKVMLEKSVAKKIYTKTFESFLTEQPTEGIADNAYDVAASVGCFLEGHIPISSVIELVRMVKVGGFVIFTLYDPGFTMNYMETLGKFMKEKLVELVSMKLEPYKRECTNNFEYVYAYTVCLKVL